MDSADENDNIFDSSVDLFDDMEVTEVHSGEETTDLLPWLNIDHNVARKCGDKRSQQLGKSDSAVVDTGGPVNQLKKITPLDSGAEECNGERFKRSLCYDEASQEGFLAGLPNKQHRFCDTENKVSDISDVDMVIEKSCVRVGTLNLANRSSDIDSGMISGQTAKASKDADTSASIKTKVDFIRSSSTLLLNDDIVLVKDDLCKDTDSEKQVAPTNGEDIIPNETDYLFHKNIFASHSDGCRDSSRNSNIRATENSMDSELICPFCFIQQDDLYHMEIHIETMHSETSNGESGETVILNRTRDHFVNGEDNPFQFVCPLCDLDLGDRVTLDLHLQAVHEEEQNEQETCPLCGVTSFSEENMKLHIKAHSTDQTVYGISGTDGGTIFSAATSSPAMTCPVCELEMIDSDLLISHVESHFNPKHKPGPDLSSPTTIKQVSDKENLAVKNGSVNQKEFPQSFKEIQTRPSRSRNGVPSTSQNKCTPSGSRENVSYKHQYEQNLERAVTSGKMSVTDYHAQKSLMTETDLIGVDNGSTRTQGLIEKLENLYRHKAWPGQTVHLCSPTDHYSGSYGDKGWGCGYRNFQMILSCLSMHPDYAQKIFTDRIVTMPSIPKIQQMIESAWKMGFDRQGCRQLGGQLVNTSKWIGATEIVATLSFLGIKCRLIDFHTPSASDGTHPRLLEWVADYFCTSQRDFLPPLYLQHQGHSRTIIGVEQNRGTVKLLLFDPGTPRDHIASIVRDQLNWKHMRTFLRSQIGFKSKQYQIVAVTGLLTDVEYEESKTLKSERVP